MCCVDSRKQEEESNMLADRYIREANFQKIEEIRKIENDNKYAEQLNQFIFGAGVKEFTDEDGDVPSEYRHKYEHLISMSKASLQDLY